MENEVRGEVGIRQRRTGWGEDWNYLECLGGKVSECRENIGGVHVRSSNPELHFMLPCRMGTRKRERDQALLDLFLRNMVGMSGATMQPTELSTD